MKNTEIEISQNDVVELIDELKKASQLYYLEGEESPLSDDEFDAKQEFLQSIQTSFPELFEKGTDGYKILEGDVLLGAEMIVQEPDNSVITHKSPMLSLAKAKKAEELDSYLKKVRLNGADDFRLQAKLDGTAISAHYENGLLEYIVTRGNGVVGENITYLVDDKNITVIGLPKSIHHTQVLEVRGELFFYNHQFERVNKNRFENNGTVFELSRSAISGITKRAKKGVPYKAEMTFGIYSAWHDGELVALDTITDDGFFSVDHLTSSEVEKFEKSFGQVKLTGFSNDEEIHKAIADFGKVSESFSIPIDGVVIKPVNEVKIHKKMGNTSHHPASQIAWKYPSEKAQTVISDIVFTVGKSGRVTPVAEFEPVTIDGSVIVRASLHNFALLREKDVRKGSLIIIEKANEIIPQVVSVISSPDNSEQIEVPNLCPSCAQTLYSDDEVYPPKTLSCVNEMCPARNFESLVFAVGRDYLDIDGLSSSTIASLHDAGLVSDLADLYSLSEKTLSDVIVGTSSKGEPIYLGQKRASKIMKHIETSKSLPLERILASFAIHTLGRRASKKLVAELKNLENILSASVDEIASIEGFGRIKAEKAAKGLEMRSELISRMKDRGVLFQSSDSTDNNDKSNSSSSVNLDGLSFAISGSVPEPFANRNAMVDYIEAHKGSFHSAPKAGTSFMIAEKDGSSSKVKKALSLGIEFITAEEFTNRFVQ